MTPTFVGRIQTRAFLLLAVALPWTLILAPFLPRPDDGSLGDVYILTLTAIALVMVLGIAWEALYHGMQQLRWEKDWPTLFGLLTGINEGILLWLVIANLPGWPDVKPGGFLIHFITVWVLVWLVANGPMRVVFLRWRFRGGRIV